MLQSLTRFQRDAGLLAAASPSELVPLFNGIDPASVLKVGAESWAKFLRDAKVEVISAANVRAPDLLNLYFSGQPPFSARKKAEFPDAISVLALEQWSRASGAQVYVVSGDPDLQAWCAGRIGMHHLRSVNDFLDLYNRAEEQLTELALAIFEREEK